MPGSSMYKFKIAGRYVKGSTIPSSANYKLVWNTGGYWEAGVDTTVPRLFLAFVDGSSLWLLYDEALDTGSVPAVGDFAVVVAGGADVVTVVAVNGSAVKLTLTTAATEGQVVTVSYTAGASPIQDIAGNDAANLVAQSVENFTDPVVVPDTQAPRLSKIYGSGTQIVLDYDEQLTENSPTITAFAVLVNSGAVTESSPVVEGHIVRFTISTALISSDTFTVAYTAGATPIQDLAGNNAADFGAAEGQNLTDRAVGGTPTTQSFGDAAAGGGSTTGADLNHVHGMPTPSVVTVFTSSGTWTKNAGTKMVQVELWGAGGGGSGGRGGAADTARQGGNGGGAGAYAEKFYDPSVLGATELVTIGSGGAGSAGGSSAHSGTATSGGNTTFGSHLTAHGAAGAEGSDSLNAGGGGGLAGAGSGSTGGVPQFITGNNETFGGGSGGNASDIAAGNSVLGGGGGGRNDSAPSGDSFPGGSSLHGAGGGCAGGGVIIGNTQHAAAAGGAFNSTSVGSGEEAEAVRGGSRTAGT